MLDSRGPSTPRVGHVKIRGCGHVPAGYLVFHETNLVLEALRADRERGLDSERHHGQGGSIFNILGDPVVSHVELLYQARTLRVAKTRDRGYRRAVTRDDGLN